MIWLYVFITACVLACIFLLASVISAEDKVAIIPLVILIIVAPLFAMGIRDGINTGEIKNLRPLEGVGFNKLEIGDRDNEICLVGEEDKMGPVVVYCEDK